MDLCRYSVDLLRPTQDEYEGMPTYGKGKFNGEWNVKDAWVKQWLDRIVADHYKSHLDQEGIAVIQEGNKVSHIHLRLQLPEVAADLLRKIKFKWANQPSTSSTAQQHIPNPVKPENAH